MQQDYKYHYRSNGNTPSDPSDKQFDEEKFDDEIQVSSCFTLAKFT